ncbi:syntaxin-binding protein 5-like [Tropilaelaps mercedesae]|uniref:Syntaxin-binding protein 5-like n=1 Tax=Tropilaelaps mercedesae TaxID=418985 RepID=A0A1V9XAJ6_9ACAR|nr:syntaxin-binding protein 5-like [Tropilaelaps mercedesae]
MYSEFLLAILAYRSLGRPGVEVTVQHVLDCPVVQLQFIVNEGLLLSLCADDQIHEWNIKGRSPEIVHSLKFQKERVTFIHLPFQSKWLYLGTEGGNVHVINIDTFSLSGYVINWNKAIEISRKTKPGAVVHLSENPVDSNKLLIGFETGTIVLWDLRSRAAEVRFQYNEALSSVSWHFEGKQFMASHGDGSLTTFNIRQPGKPQSVLYPHARTKALAQGGGGFDSVGPPGTTGLPLVVQGSSRNNLLPITKVQWRTTRAGDNCVIFSGGLPFEKGNSEVSTLTVSQGRSTTVLEMESPILDFLTLNDSPFAFDTQDPFAVVALLRSDLVFVDLMTQAYPCFRNPYSMDIHESTVVCCQYLADCPGDLIPCLYSVGAKAANQSRHFSDREWPITGGEWGPVLDTPIHFEMEEPAPLEVPPRGQAVCRERITLRPCPQKWASGLQPSLVCQFLSGGAIGGNADHGRRITSMAVSSAYNLLAFGNDSGLVVVDTVHNTCVLNFATPELYEPQPKSPNLCQPTSPAAVPAPLPPDLPAIGYSNTNCQATEAELTLGTSQVSSSETTLTDGETPAQHGQKSRKSETIVKENKVTEESAEKNNKSIGNRDDGADKSAKKYGKNKHSSGFRATVIKSRRADNLRHGRSIQETITDVYKRTLQRMVSSPSIRSADPYQRSPRSPKRQDNGLPDPAENSPDQTPYSGGTSGSWLSASSHQQLTTMSSLGAHPGRKMLQRHPNLASQDEPPQFLLTAANNTGVTSSSGD